MGIDISKLKEAYLIEAEMHVKAINNALVNLEKNPEDKTLFHEVFRGIHTLKSLAATMDYGKTTKLCHAMEDLMDKIRNREIKLENSIDILFKANDYLHENLKILEDNKRELDSSHLISLLQTIIQGGTEPALTFLKNESMALEKIQTIAVKVDRLDTLMNLAEELLVNKLKFDLLRDQNINPELNSAVESLGRLITDLQYYVLQVRLVPIGFVFNRFNRMVRDLGKEQNKPIDLVIEGGDIELDRLLIDEIGVSIAHLIRNAIDHGIEPQSERQKQNKPVKGTIKLCATRTKENAIIEVTDDGAGLDFPAIKKLAMKQKALSGNMDNDEFINIIFSGVSTKKYVTETSGRGLGLTIVKEKIESIGGSIKVKSEAGKFTSFFMEIPLTLAIIKTLFVKVAEEIYAIPIEAVERLLGVSGDNLKYLLTDETIIFQDQDIPVVRLADLFILENLATTNHFVVLIKKDKSRIGLLVDQLLSTQEIVIKPLNKAVKNNKYFSGAAMIGSGQIVLILDVNYLLTLTNRKQHAS